MKGRAEIIDFSLLQETEDKIVAKICGKEYTDESLSMSQSECYFSIGKPQIFGNIQFERKVFNTGRGAKNNRV